MSFAVFVSLSLFSFRPSSACYEAQRYKEKNALPRNINTTFGISLKLGFAFAATCEIRYPGQASTWLSLMFPADMDPTIFTALPSAMSFPRREYRYPFPSEEP
jgi:hypothetical protein